MWNMKKQEKKKTHFLIHNEGSRSIANRWLPGISHFWTLSVLEELEIQPETVWDSPPNLCNHVEEDTDGMATTDGVAVLFEVVGEACWIHPLNDWHTSLVQGLERERMRCEVWGVRWVVSLPGWTGRSLLLRSHSGCSGTCPPSGRSLRRWQNTPRDPGGIWRISCHISPPSWEREIPPWLGQWWSCLVRAASPAHNLSGNPAR